MSEGLLVTPSGGSTALLAIACRRPHRRVVTARTLTVFAYLSRSVGVGVAVHVIIRHFDRMTVLLLSLATDQCDHHDSNTVAFFIYFWQLGGWVMV